MHESRQKPDHMFSTAYGQEVPMKKLLVALAAMLAISGVAHAERQVALSKEGVLTVNEVTRVNLLTVTGVPKGLSADVAYKLVTGELKESMVENKRGGNTSVWFSFPRMGTEIEHDDKKITYRNRTWFVEPVAKRVTRPDDSISISVVAIWFPACAILVLSLSLLFGSKKKEIFIFYGTILVGGPVGAFVGWLSDDIMAGMYAGMLTGLILSAFAPFNRFTSSIVRVMLGALAGASVGAFASALILTNTFGAAQYYGFVLGVEVLSFAIVQTIGYARARMQTTATSG